MTPIPVVELHRHIFTEIYDELKDTKSDIVMILDSCYSGLATRGVEAETTERNVEKFSAVGSVQKALGNFKDALRMQNNTFTCRLSTEVARRAGRGDQAISFAEIVPAPSVRHNIVFIRGTLGLESTFELRRMLFIDQDRQKATSRHQVRQLRKLSPSSKYTLILSRLPWNPPPDLSTWHVRKQFSGPYNPR